jgi:hypothetical protein
MTVRTTHIGGPTVLLEVEGWRLLTDPTFDPPGPPLQLRLGLEMLPGSCSVYRWTMSMVGCSRYCVSLCLRSFRDRPR